jgi:hypothetical protein
MNSIKKTRNDSSRIMKDSPLCISSMMPKLPYVSLWEEIMAMETGVASKILLQLSQN